MGTSTVPTVPCSASCLGLCLKATLMTSSFCETMARDKRLTLSVRVIAMFVLVSMSNFARSRCLPAIAMSRGELPCEAAKSGCVLPSTVTAEMSAPAGTSILTGSTCSAAMASRRGVFLCGSVGFRSSVIYWYALTSTASIASSPRDTAGWRGCSQSLPSSLSKERACHLTSSSASKRVLRHFQ